MKEQEHHSMEADASEVSEAVAASPSGFTRRSFLMGLGATAALIGRPYAVAVYGGDSVGVSCYSNKLKFELREAMMMTGALTLDDITKDKLFLPEWAK